jgi:hypothetical protein
MFESVLTGGRSHPYWSGPSGAPSTSGRCGDRRAAACQHPVMGLISPRRGRDGMVDIRDLKSRGGIPVRVQVPPPAPIVRPPRQFRAAFWRHEPLDTGGDCSQFAPGVSRHHCPVATGAGNCETSRPRRRHGLMQYRKPAHYGGGGVPGLPTAENMRSWDIALDHRSVPAHNSAPAWLHAGRALPRRYTAV